MEASITDRDVKRGRKARPPEVRGASLENLRQEHIGRLFLLGSRVFERLALAELRANGFDDLRLVHLALIRALPVEGLRTTEIGEIAGMTKQAVGQLAIELEKAGYVVRLPDPTDGRAKLVRYAARGQSLVAVIPQVLLRAEARIEQMVGGEDFIVMRRALRRLLALSGEAQDSHG
ncbi:transcriptional regulator, MarR family [Rhizorhabdus wittichii RW1]|jgi:DNA-binding MarR family transcriptional regulator|uniref:Transcriptional regulator, MarR family n=1 Tax=Rhizorhabdus wittichii (strain DSM 6014 / CCUG 31198 / JCM 15750 / NBRC 105917 / EY 4224 / RW1) TaxID=392499 RepID=A0A9J9HFF8_RHIWR|nr:transcriptional regulator, MarR family [Rhizorhabdus wittichii RW1]